MMNSLDGDKIINLFNNSFDTEDSLDQIEAIFQKIQQCIKEDNPDQAITHCHTALKKIDEISIEIKAATEITYSRGKCYLLLASIYLNKNKNWNQAETYFARSYELFASRVWSHLEALALFGLAIARRKLRHFDEAIDICQLARKRIVPELTPEHVKLDQLEEAIWQEETTIAKLKPITPPADSSPAEKTLPLFKISTGKEMITAGDTTDANFLSRREYEQVSQPEQVVINVDQVAAARYADYILEIDDQVDQAVDDLNKGDWLLIREEENPDQLSHKPVAVLLQQNGRNQVSLKTFTKVSNHYFLEAAHQNATCIAVVDFDGEFEKVNSFYKNFHRPVEVVWVHTVRMSGIVGGHVPKANINASYILQIPILNDISAGLGVIAESDIIGACDVRSNVRKSSNFAVNVVGNSMKQDNISDGDIALFHPQPTVKQGDIAAIVITTPEMEPQGVIKRYRIVYEKRDDLRHWLLESSNPSSPHLVVMPLGAHEAAIEQMYAKSVKAEKIVQPEFYRNAKVSIAGKYIGKCEERVLKV